MDETFVSGEASPRAATFGGVSGRGVLLLLLLLSAALLSIYELGPPSAATADAPAAEFSSARAMRHLAEIAAAPRPMGSAEHSRVREYIIGELRAQGLSPEVQEVTAVNRTRGNPFYAGTVRNVVATLAGSGNSKAVVLAAHYDSVATGPGAFDAGAGLATMLETLRALKAGPALKNDVVFLFTDGEEVGLLGAQAFADEHPLAKQAGVVLNFDARGNSGPVIMFETSPGNGRLVEEFAAAAPQPVANSFVYDLYRLLPNDTDFTVFKRAGLEGYNFANIGGFTSYHTLLDNVSNADGRTLQHQGSYARVLARHFGNVDFGGPRREDVVYFSLPGSLLVNYPQALGSALAVLAALAFAAALVVGVRKGRLRWRGVALGFLALLLSMGGAYAAGALLWRGVRALRTDDKLLGQGNTYQSHLYMIACVLFAAALTAAVYFVFRRRAGVLDLAAGALLWWLLLLAPLAVLLPGSSYLLTWPLLFSLAAVFVLLLTDAREFGSWGHVAVLALCALPGVLLLVPAIYLVSAATALGMAGWVMVMVVLLVGLLVPHLDLLKLSHRWVLPGALLTACVGFLVAGVAASGFSAAQPRSDSLFYALDADTGKAVWGSVDQAPDEWTEQYLTASPQRSPLTEFFPSSSWPFLHHGAPPAPLDAPRLEVLGDETAGEVRTLRARVSSPRQAPVVAVYAGAGVEVVAAAVNGKAVQPPSQASPGGQKNWALLYSALPPEGVELTCSVKAAGPVTLKVVDRSYELPELPGTSFRPRPAHLMPALGQFNGMTLVSKSFSF